MLDSGYQQGLPIASGPKNPRDGGVMISQAKDRATLDAFLKQDPFYVHDLAEYQVIEFEPNKYQPDFACFVKE